MQTSGQFHAGMALRMLQEALKHAKEARNKRTADRIRAAISSARGACRVQDYRANRNFDQ